MAVPTVGVSVVVVVSAAAAAAVAQFQVQSCNIATHEEKLLQELSCMFACPATNEEAK